MEFKINGFLAVLLTAVVASFLSWAETGQWIQTDAFFKYFVVFALINIIYSLHREDEKK